MSKKQAPNRKPYRFGILARWLLGKVIPSKYHIEYLYDAAVEEIKPPYFIIGNHTSFLDPFIVGIGCKDFVNHVANDEYFRFRMLAFLMHTLGAIPKTKNMSDYECVKKIMEMKNQNDVICIYAEGGRTWQGETQPLLLSTSKLIKKLRIPVVTCLTKGGSLSFPRWAKHFRKGRIFVEYQIGLTPEQIDQMDISQIHQYLTAALSFNETTWNKTHQIAFQGKKLAEHLEWFLYACPKCHQFETMTSQNDIYQCTCGYQVRYTPWGLFEPVNDTTLIHDDVIEWNKDQYQIMLEKASRLQENARLLEKVNVTLFNGKRRQRQLCRLFTGQLMLDQTGLIITGAKATSIFLYEKIEGILTNHKNVIDFYYEEEKYRIELSQKLECGYIIEDAVKAMKQIKSTKNEKSYQ